jgi:hypothetical protein
MTLAIGYILSGLLAAAITVIGARFLVAPRAAAAGYGVQPDFDQPAVRAYLSVKGVRDIAAGLIVVAAMVAGTPHLVGWIMLAAIVIPLADAAIVVRNDGPKSIAWGAHVGTAAVMLATVVLLFVS